VSLIVVSLERIISFILFFSFENLGREGGEGRERGALNELKK